jgi:hypothetical protein
VLFGLTPLGNCCQFVYHPAPVPLADASTFGVDGIKGMPAGNRGGTSTLLSLLSAPSREEIALALDLLRSLNDGKVRPLVDLGNTWPASVMRGLTPVGRALQTADGWFALQVKMEFLHLV